MIQDNGLASIPGNGARRPEMAFVFINPTHSNISSLPSWKGPRFPFCGVPKLWRIFARAGIIDGSRIPEKWDEKSAERFLRHLKERRIYLTNLVKRTEWTSENPSWKEVKRSLPGLIQELKSIQARRIVAMGVLPTKALAGINVKMSEEYRKAVSGRIPEYHANGFAIHPCYFPVGRGNPKRAEEMLRIYWSNK